MASTQEASPVPEAPWALQRMLDEHHQSWSPLSLSSHSASTEYFSNTTSPYAVANSEFLATPLRISSSFLFRDRGAGSPQGSDPPHWANLFLPSSSERKLSQPSNPDHAWPEELSWSEPIALEHCTDQCFEPIAIEENSCSQTAADKTTELRYTLSQEQVDQHMVEMTCGPKLEEHFWPIRYQIRHGKLHAYENATHALIVHARKKMLPAMVSKLSNQLASCRVCSHSSLAAFLEGSLGQYERLSQVRGRKTLTDYFNNAAFLL
ncbi:hypothetical protein K438DRAFT_355539 [Mycena galopus ATCC 62051]|nr:hypothetical protein K438DRAFT_355539 [Mycena galopus ATCC 62051]